jgi:hypothetical protein
VLERWADPNVLVKVGKARLTALIVKASHNHLGAERAERWLAAARASIELYPAHPAVPFADLVVPLTPRPHQEGMTRASSPHPSATEPLRSLWSWRSGRCSTPQNPSHPRDPPGRRTGGLEAEMADEHGKRIETIRLAPADGDRGARSDLPGPCIHEVTLPVVGAARHLLMPVMTAWRLESAASALAIADECGGRVPPTAIPFSFPDVRSASLSRGGGKESRPP